MGDGRGRQILTIALTSKDENIRDEYQDGNEDENFKKINNKDVGTGTRTRTSEDEKFGSWNSDNRGCGDEHLRGRASLETFGVF